MRHMMKILAGATVATAFSTLGFANSAEAIILTLDFSGANFTDNGNLTGTFDYDTTTETYSNFNITAASGATVNNSFTYTTANSTSPGDNFGFNSNSDTQFTIDAVDSFVASPDTDRDIRFVFDQTLNTLSNVGDSRSLVTSGNASQEQVEQGAGNFQIRSITGGVVTVTDVEDPNDPQAVPFEAETSIALALLGGWGAWKRWKSRRANANVN
ncbi:hypothetical protein PCC7418_0857 [Halothece sp. PCC 7418]|uniref:PFE-CTERM domain-containing protein n=1 Tax=Halothece sp. (strain PCC 7418) TaxID=65093 RepID=UPI0002A06959|nr:hypothetical protein [Halothece sp. PCC 7418]AFZ43072.1 hypothetical protein PCC7418_0857 [Halothece sp. PCC 7418]